MSQPEHLKKARERAVEARRKRAERPIPPGYDPLAYCPENLRAFFKPKADAALGGSLSALIDLACIHCMGWQYREVSGCTDPSCPLWIRATRKRAGTQGEPLAPPRERERDEHMAP